MPHAPPEGLIEEIASCPAQLRRSSRSDARRGRIAPRPARPRTASRAFSRPLGAAGRDCRGGDPPVVERRKPAQGMSVLDRVLVLEHPADVEHAALRARTRRLFARHFRRRLERLADRDRAPGRGRTSLRPAPDPDRGPRRAQRRPLGRPARVGRATPSAIRWPRPLTGEAVSPWSTPASWLPAELRPGEARVVPSPRGARSPIPNRLSDQGSARRRSVRRPTPAGRSPLRRPGNSPAGPAGG